jgi:hypothetical protein
MRHRETASQIHALQDNEGSFQLLSDRLLDGRMDSQPNHSRRSGWRKSDHVREIGVKCHHNPITFDLRTPAPFVRRAAEAGFNR